MTLKAPSSFSLSRFNVATDFSQQAPWTADPSLIYIQVKDSAERVKDTLLRWQKCDRTKDLQRSEPEEDCDGPSIGNNKAILFFFFFNNSIHCSTSVFLLLAAGLKTFLSLFFGTIVHRTFGEAWLYCLKRFIETSELGLCSKVQIVLGCSS